MKVRIISVAVMALLSACNDASKVAVRERLLDPQSAEFRKLEACHADHSVVAGEVNAKNLHGAFTGFAPFYVANDAAVFVSDLGFEELMARCYGSDLASLPNDAFQRRLDDSLAWRRQQGAGAFGNSAWR